jgi:hypothetical protein
MALPIYIDSDMTKKVLISISLVLTSAILLLLSLVRYADTPNANKNGFIRKLLINKIAPLHYTSTITPLSVICGVDPKQITFRGKDPLLLITANYSLTNQDSLNLPIPLNKSLLRGSSVFRDTSNVNLYIYNFSTDISYKIGDTIFYENKLPCPLFTRIVPLNSRLIAVRAFDSSRTKQVFEIIDKQSKKIIKHSDVIPNQTDAGLSSDGLLQYDSASKRLVYVQFYQNKIFCFDTSLNLLYIFHTIDTINTNPVLTKSFMMENKTGNLVPSVPLTIVNKAIYAYGGNLFVLSNLQADNETSSVFLKSSVIDIYDLSNGIYKGSFYVPDMDREKINSFALSGNIFIALYNNHIATFQLNL